MNWCDEAGNPGASAAQAHQVPERPAPLWLARAQFTTGAGTPCAHRRRAQPRRRAPKRDGRQEDGPDRDNDHWSTEDAPEVAGWRRPGGWKGLRVRRAEMGSQR